MFTEESMKWRGREVVERVARGGKGPKANKKEEKLKRKWHSLPFYP